MLTWSSQFNLNLIGFLNWIDTKRLLSPSVVGHFITLHNIVDRTVLNC